MAKKTQQQDLPTHKATALEKASRDYLLRRGEVEDAKTVMERAGIALVDEMKKEGRTSLIIEGQAISIETVSAKEKLKVKSLEQR